MPRTVKDTPAARAEREYTRQWRAANKDKVRAQNARRRAKETPEQREARLEYMKRYREENRERLRAYEAGYREQHRERVNEKARRYYHRKRAERADG